MDTTYLEYRNGKTRKFWKVELDGDTRTLTQGKLGAKKPPTPKAKTFKTAAAAEKSVAKAIAKKRSELFFDPGTLGGILEDHAETLHVHTDAEVAAHRAAYPHAPDAYFDVWRTGALEVGLLSDWGALDKDYDGGWSDLAYLFPVYSAAEDSLDDVDGADALDPFFYLCGQLADGSQLALINCGEHQGKLTLFEHEPPEELVDHIVPGDPAATFAAWESEGLMNDGFMEQPYEDFVRDHLLARKAGAVEALIALREALAAVDAAAEGDPLALTELSLSDQSLRMLPDSVGEFANLEVLDLHENEFTEVPPVIRKLTKLRDLNLYYQAWNFDVATALPDWIGELPLRKLNLGNNTCSSIPDGLFELVDLEALELGRDLEMLPAKFAMLKQLRTLDISGLGGFEPGALAGMTALRKLDLGRIGAPLPDEIGELEHLEHLSFAGHGWTLTSAVGRLANLRHLASGSTEIPDEIGQLSKLETWVCPTHGTSLPESIGDLESLRELNLHYARITALPESIGKLHNLEAIVAESSYFETLPPSFSALKNLKSARLNCAVDLEIGDRIAGLENLEYLTLNYDALDTVPRSTWATLTNLRTIKMYKGRDDEDAVAKFAFLRDLPAIEQVSPPYQLRSTLQAAYPEIGIS